MDKCVETRSFQFFANSSRSKQQQKKDCTHPFVKIGEYETCPKFQQKILNYRLVKFSL